MILTTLNMMVFCTSQALVAAKTMYFGVGGGVHQFEGSVRAAGLAVAAVAGVEEGVGRQILRVTA